MRIKYCLLLLLVSCFTAMADTIPEPGLATPAYVPAPVAISTPTYVSQPETTYIQTQSITVQTTTYYNQPTYVVPPVQLSRYGKFVLEREQMFGNAYIRR